MSLSLSSHYDVVVIGAGIAGIEAAYNLQKYTKKSFVVLEARDTFGGTWDLFKYPGIRSDSDMFSFTYSFHPWTSKQTFGSAHDITSYLKEVLDTHDLSRHIVYQQKVVSAGFDSNQAKWKLSVQHGSVVRDITTYFICCCTGYYDYEEGYTPDIPGLKSFKGTLIHPQKWPANLNLTGKKVIVIGSGATAVTIVPAIQKTAARVTMLQRSPTYILPVPSQDLRATWLLKIPILGSLLRSAIFKFTRLFWIGLGILSFWACRNRAPYMRKAFLAKMHEMCGEKYKKDFTPSYNPWEQRLCAAPDGDFYIALAQKNCSVVTAHIETITDTGVRLKIEPDVPQKELEADVLVTATGLKLSFGGKIEFSVDGRNLNPADCFIYRGFMLSDFPNFFYVFGYSNAAWTLKCELTSAIVKRILKHMSSNSYDIVCPQLTDPASLPCSDTFNLSSSYLQRDKNKLPKSSSKFPWAYHQNYVYDTVDMVYKSLNDGVLTFRKRTPLSTSTDVN